jgi:hypothetical protein
MEKGANVPMFKNCQNWFTELINPPNEQSDHGDGWQDHESEDPQRRSAAWPKTREETRAAGCKAYPYGRNHIWYKGAHVKRAAATFVPARPGLDVLRDHRNRPKHKDKDETGQIDKLPGVGWNH